MILPNSFLQDITNSKVVLILGAGASMEASDGTGNTAPSGRELGEKLAEHILDSTFVDAPLSQISEFAINEADIVTVQSFVADLMRPFQPSTSHLMLAKHRWHGLATTNYDQLVEMAYGIATSPLQRPVPFIANADRIDNELSQPNSVSLLKLHGCVTRANDAKVPFILTPDQYVEYLHGRSHVFQLLTDWAREHSFVFVGNRVDDINLRAILLRLSREIPSLPRSFLVTPDSSGILSRFWEKRNIRVLPGTFNDFMNAI